LAVSAGRGPKGDGFTGGTYDAGTGKVTFTSNDGIGFSTDDLRGDLTEPGPIGSVTPSTGAFTSLSTTGNAVIGGDLTVEGTTTTVDSTTVAVGDKNVELAKDATTAAEADGGGITLNGASATITYSSANDYWALNKGLNVSGNVSLSGTVDGRDVAADGSKLDGIESGATADQTAGEIKTSYESNADTNAFTDSEKTKLSNIESNADVTDTANVTAAGALMDSELTSEASVKALDQGVATTDSPDFAGLTVDTDTLYVDSSNNRVGIGTSSPNHEVSVREVNPTLILEDSQAALTSGGVAGSILFYNNDSSTPRGARVTASIKQVAEDIFGRTSLVFGTDTSNPKSEFGDPADYSDDTIEAMRIDSSGNVGIGTSSPDEALTIQEGSVKTRISLGTTEDHHTFANSAGTRFAGIGLLASSADLYIEDDTGDSITFDRSEKDIKFETNGSEAMRIDSSGNVGIGTSSPANTLHVAADDATLRLTTTSNLGEAGIEFWDNQSGTSQAAAIRYSDQSNLFTIQGNSNGTIFMTPDNTFPSASEAMRIDSSGNLRISNTSGAVYPQTTGAGQFYWRANESSLALSHNNSSGFSPLYVNKFNFTAGSSNNRFVAWYVNGSPLATITTDGASVSYNTSSDYRLKENIKPMSGASDRVLALNPVNFTWKTNGTSVDGFLAHEAQEVVPEAVTGEKDALDSEGNPEYQGIDQGKLVPLLTAALQDALQKIEQLETRIEALENTQ
jgi:hypothetical protein